MPSAAWAAIFKGLSDDRAALTSNPISTRAFRLRSHSLESIINKVFSSQQSREVLTERLIYERGEYVIRLLGILFTPLVPPHAPTYRYLQLQSIVDSKSNCVHKLIIV